ncbi:STN domain-containing protein [Bradyrhizobium cenepequi]|uniref:STN domain-containing protein n=1 Tax=Bradyrhizobium cenepequi TaxID=2821403 RepID=UPI001CE2D063|nr:STN domain-containing protein [Bradyrhizobium cenepequi]
MAASSLAIIVASGLTDGRQSSSLKGSFTPEQALRRMLAGTGLEARAVGSGLFTLVQGTARPPLPRFIDFAAAVQAAVTDALCRRSDARPTSYRTVMRLWFDPAGVVTRAELGHSTGDRKLDMAVTSTLQHLDVGAPLPSGLPQPVKLAIMPRATESAACPAERPGLRAQDDFRSVAQGAGR